MVSRDTEIAAVACLSRDVLGRCTLDAVSARSLTEARDNEVVVVLCLMVGLDWHNVVEWVLCLMFELLWGNEV
jgi:hypothetical protein